MTTPTVPQPRFPFLKKGEGKLASSRHDGQTRFAEQRRQKIETENESKSEADEVVEEKNTATQ